VGHFTSFVFLLFATIPSCRPALLPLWPFPVLYESLQIPLGSLILLTCLASALTAYTDFARGPPSSPSTFFSWGGGGIPANPSSAGYRLLTAASLLGGIFVAATLNPPSPSIVPVQLLGTACLSLLVACELVLADAAERGRLAATTFRRLNAALALVFLSAGGMFLVQLKAWVLGTAFLAASGFHGWHHVTAKQ